MSGPNCFALAAWPEDVQVPNFNWGRRPDCVVQSMDLQKTFPTKARAEFWGGRALDVVGGSSAIIEGGPWVLGGPSGTAQRKPSSFGLWDGSEEHR